MKFVLFYHSLISDWNHGNAHFLRGIATELLARGHAVEIYEPVDSWSVRNLVEEYGVGAIDDFHAAYPGLTSHLYQLAELDLDEVLRDADIVLMHEWSDHSLVARVGEYRRTHDHFRLLFHDTHHRAITERSQMAAYDLRHYDGVLAYGAILRDLYLAEGWTRQAWTWHEAADTRVFHPHPEIAREGDVIWVGNWGDDERTAELHEFLIDPIRRLHLKAKVHGVRYPEAAQQALAEAGIEYGNWLPNFRAPEAFAQYRLTVHVPRRPYVQALRGIPTIRPFEALACGIPLISAPWDDAEGLFRPGTDYLIARDGAEMQQQMQLLLESEDRAQEVAAAGLETILARHTCAHRVEELLQICGGL
jgi:spore maturation protein CgeB